jgi:hypothetical protein
VVLTFVNVSSRATYDFIPPAGYYLGETPWWLPDGHLVLSENTIESETTSLGEIVKIYPDGSDRTLLGLGNRPAYAGGKKGGTVFFDGYVPGDDPYAARDIFSVHP